MSVADWDNEYARWARSASQLRTAGLRPNPGSPTVSDLQAGLQGLEAQLMSLPLPAGELQRRRRLVQHLQQTSTTSGNHDHGSAEASASLSGSQQQQQQSQMTSAMRQQDDMIDQLAMGVGRLKTQTAAIGQEASMHVNLMSNMEEGLDAAHDGLLDQTRRAASLRQDQSLWKLQLIVAGLFVLLVLLIFTGLTP